MHAKQQQLLESSNLPTLPTAAVRLLELSKSPDAGIADLCETIKSDPAISVRVIRAANASFFGLRTEVTSIEKAAMMLGPGMLTTITLTFYLAQQSVSSGPEAQHFSSFWLRTVIQAAASESILEFKELKGKSAAFLAGLVCDIGQLAMLRVFPEDYAAFSDESKDKGEAIVEIEHQHLGFDHVGIGVDLANKWGLPQSIVEAIAHHHLPLERLQDTSTLENQDTVNAAIVGSAVADHLCGGGVANTWRVLRTTCNTLFGLTDDQLVEYLTRVHERVSDASGLFGIDTTKLPDLTTIMSEAAELLTENTFDILAMTHQAVTEKQEVQKAKLELERANREMHERMIRDALTGVYSRAYFEEQLTAEIKKCNRSGSPLGLIFCDIDHFKSLNDRYGHPFGDHALKLVAETLQSTLRESDVLARYGGEEFVAILTTKTLEDLRDVAEKMRRAIDQLRIRSSEGTVRITISAGACFSPQVNGDLRLLRNEMIRNADAAMYTAKQNGRNQIRLAEAAPADCHATRLGIALPAETNAIPMATRSLTSE